MIEGFGDVNIHRAKFDTASAARAGKRAVLAGEVIEFAVIAVAEPFSLCFPWIVAARNFAIGFAGAAIPNPDAFKFLLAILGGNQFIADIKAATGRADISANSAAETAFSGLFPDRKVEKSSQAPSSGKGINGMSGGAGLSISFSSQVHAGGECFTSFGDRIHNEAIFNFGEQDIKVIGAVGPFSQAGAEAGRQGFLAGETNQIACVLDGTDNCDQRFGIQEHGIQNFQSVGITWPNAEDDSLVFLKVFMDDDI